MFCRSLFVFTGVRVTQSLVFCVVICRSLLVFSGVGVPQSLVLCVVFCTSLFVFTARTPVKNKQYNDLQNTTQKTKD
jgi:hypothetical protein